MVGILIFFGLVILILVIIFLVSISSHDKAILYTKDGMYKKKGDKGYVSRLENALLSEEESMQAIDISKIPVESFGREEVRLVIGDFA